MDIIALSEKQAEVYEPSEREVCISIVSPESEEANLSEKFEDVLRLEFHDIDLASHDPGRTVLQVSPFSEEQAREILEFYNQYVQIVDRIMIHCEAGVSRSVGVQRALQIISGTITPNELDRWWKHGNFHVKNTILEEAGLDWKSQLEGREEANE